MKKRTVLIILIILGSIILIFSSIIGIRYIKYRNLIGEYELIEQNNTEGLLTPLKFNLYSWNQGNKEDLKCDLWNCSGYEHGIIYYTKGDNIIFKYDRTNSIKYKYKIEKRNNEIYLILKDHYEDNYIKYRKKK